MSGALHPIERKILSALAPLGSAPFEALVAATSLNEDQVRRALQWLASKRLVTIGSSVEDKLELVREPPELGLLLKVSQSKAPPTIGQLRGEYESPEEFSAAFGRARRSGWISLEGGSTPVIRIIDATKSEPLRSLVRSIASGKSERDLTKEESGLVADLLKRGIVRHTDTRTSTIAITDEGRRFSSPQESETLIDKLTPNILATGAWRGRKLRPIDVEAKAPTYFPGRRHPVRDFIREVREVYISMGFTELQGGSVHPAFWNFDALFIPQDHPGREMQDTFYLEGLSDRALSRSGVVAKVASTHEDGWETGSRGWGYHWRIEEARRLVLRTHNTVLSVRALSESKESETRVFAVSKVYRNENLDYKHLAEFYQMDGIMVGEGLNTRHLMGFLTEFYKKLGMADVKLWPTYFPYTEPSLQVVGYSKAFKSWIELGGSGVFRPEVTRPLGVKVPVLAWGPGIERLMLMRYGLEDMRTLYGSDISWLRNRGELAGS
ncbi:MAG: phenylalanine--tRNA ligase subunit alpha [Nitrososphaerota archaeon]|jgi:phenylalanyl-tRNA synthetase alpha chain|nr:phenylalanine--tRNA ligase subunit alpha [Nitrososphaerota archaeon]MDG6942853.1 phenylalanine--tRNA ligase subunit alpha [Nitrososphaerota archaeon]MDG6950827.1 phenylalanine--tRNA ligase subunit alpha [Nitrososphaerota archaeon]